jgi:hypothetical protein
MFNLSATINLGNGLIRVINDLVLDCSSEQEAKQKYKVYLESKLPEWQKIDEITIA